MLLLFLLEAALLALLHFHIRGRVQCPFRDSNKHNPIDAVLFPVSLYISDRLIYGRFKAYERKLNTKLTVLYGTKDVKDRLRVYYGNKIKYLLVTLLGMTLLGALTEKPDTTYGLFAAIAAVVVFYLPDRELNERVKRRNFYILYEFPDFLNKLVLLVNAGLTVQRAWEKIVSDRKHWTPLYEELNQTFLEIRNGKPEAAAYEDFARRCRVKEITKLVATIMQNLRKGNNELVALLRLQANECWQLRKNMARKLGEEASTKLVLPLMIMMVGILIIVIIPAVLQLRYL